MMGSSRVVWTCAFLLAFLALSGCGTRKSDINTWQSQGDASKIEGFVSGSLRSSQPDEVVTHGVDALIRMEADSSLRRLGSHIGGDLPQSYNKKLAEALNERSVLPTSSSSLCEGLVRREISDNVELDTLLEMHDGVNLGKCIIETVSSIQKEDSSKDNLYYLNNVKKYDFDSPKLVKLSISNLEKVSRLESKHRELSNEFEEIEDLLDKRKEEKEKIENNMEESVRIVAYMVGLIEKTSIGNIYEIAKFDQYGDVSREHAYLITKETSFKSKGEFAMEVKKTGSVKTKLKEEYGGFNQDWEVYVESNIPDNALEKVNRLEIDIFKIEERRERTKRQKNETSAEIKKTKIVIEEVFDGDDDFGIVDIGPSGDTARTKGGEGAGPEVPNKVDCRLSEEHYTGNEVIRCAYNEISVRTQPSQKISKVGGAALMNTEMSVGVSLNLAIEEAYFDGIEEVYASIDGERHTFEAKKVQEGTINDGQVAERIVFIVPREKFDAIADADSFHVKALSTEFDAEMVMEQFARMKEIIENAG
jgi:hypothetical protein